MPGKPVVIPLNTEELKDAEMSKAPEAVNLIKEKEMVSSREELSQMGASKRYI